MEKLQIKKHSSGIVWLKWRLTTKQLAAVLIKVKKYRKHQYMTLDEAERKEKQINFNYKNIGGSKDKVKCIGITHHTDRSGFSAFTQINRRGIRLAFMRQFLFMDSKLRDEVIARHNDFMNYLLAKK